MIEVVQKWGIVKHYNPATPIKTYRHYRPVLPFEEIKGYILVIPGYTNHADVHYELCDFLSKKGYVVVAANLRGHGSSHGHRFSVKSFEDYSEDIAGVLSVLTYDIPDFPSFESDEEKINRMKIHVIGHSHGALAAHYACEKSLKLAYYNDDGVPAWSQTREISSLTLVCPYYELNNKNYKLLKTLSAIFSYIVPHLIIPTGGIPENVIDDEKWQTIAKYDALNKGTYNFSRLPLVSSYLNGSRFALSWANASAKAQDYVSNNTKISIPMQFITADNDTVAVNSTTEKMFDKLKSNNPKNILQKFNGKHDLLRCLVREEVFESILQFIESVKN